MKKEKGTKHMNENKSKSQTGSSVAIAA